jgi:chromosome segregation ATPase
VHEGILMEIIRSGTSDWQAGLDSLSGGQRTMVSLAFVVAAATAGSATSVLLMDEVDAALDETNQALVRPCLVVACFPGCILKAVC